MKAVAVFPGKSGSIQLADLPEPGVDYVLAAQYPGWLERMLTHPVQGLDDYDEMIRLLTEERSAIKVFVEVNGRR
jgi:hypothetical protein